MSNREVNSITAIEPIPGMPRMEIVYKPIGWFKEYFRNPRKNDIAVDRMCASIREFGFAVAMLGRSTGEIVDGHLRYKGARKVGLTELPVVLCDHWTLAQVKAFRLMVNRSVTWADWDDELLSLELLDLKDLDFDVGLTGFAEGTARSACRSSRTDRRRCRAGGSADTYLRGRRSLAAGTASVALWGRDQPTSGIASDGRS
jgi:hypothetical protein